MKSAPVTTRRGDQGFTSLATGARVSKASTLIRALGSLDDANAKIGTARAHLTTQRYKRVLRHFQKHLGCLMAEVGSRGEKSYFDAKAVKQVDRRIQVLKKRCPIKPVFIIPGDTVVGAFLHEARTEVRNAERRLVQLLEDELVTSKDAVPFLNRLSDFLFVLASYEERNA